MANRKISKAFDCTLKDVTECGRNFGGNVLVFIVDFRHTFPFVPHGTREDLIASSFVVRNCGVLLWGRNWRRICVPRTI